MKVIVSDISVLIDLERGSFLESIFSLPFDFVVPDILFERELKNYNGRALIEFGLHVKELNSATLAFAIEYYRKYRTNLSLPDVFAYVLAKKNSWILLSGDAALRELAVEESVNCYGVLWLLDQLHDYHVSDQKHLYKGLRKIADHPQCRLPQVEIQNRLSSILAADSTIYVKSTRELNSHYLDH